MLDDEVLREMDDLIESLEDELEAMEDQRNPFRTVGYVVEGRGAATTALACPDALRLSTVPRRRGQTIVVGWKPAREEDAMDDESCGDANRDDESTPLGRKIVAGLRDLCDALEAGRSLEETCTVRTVQSFTVEAISSEVCDVVRPFRVFVREDGGQFTAIWPEANVGSSGWTAGEAVDNVASLAVDFFEGFQEETDDSLGPAMVEQKRVLGEHLRRRGDG